MFFEEHLEEKFEEEYNKIYYSVKHQLENDPAYTYEHLLSYLDSLYVHDGQDWYGRGELFQVKINAHIAAAECLRDEFSHLANK